MHDDDDLPVVDHRPAVDRALDEAELADAARASAQRRLEGIRSARELVQALQLLAGVCQSTAAIVQAGKYPPPTWAELIAHRYDLVRACAAAWAERHQPGGVR